MDQRPPASAYVAAVAHTPARIVDKRPVEVMLPDGQGGWMSGTADLSGMVALDEPTLEHYQNLDAGK